MTLDNLPAIITLLIILAVAAERFVEMIKGVVPWLNLEKPDPIREGWRKAAIQLLAVAGGIVVSVLAYPVIKEVLPRNAAQASVVEDLTGGKTVMTVIALGLLASGGSGFWNSILGYVQRLKDIRAAQAEAATRPAPAVRPVPHPAEGKLRP
jgi:hypothetical protein